MTDERRAYGYALLTVACWSTVASAFKLTLRYLDVLQMLVFACAVSVAVLLIVLILQGSFQLLLSMTGRQWLRSLIAGTLNPFIYYLILFSAYDRLPAQVAQPINYTWAITLSLLSILILKQRITRRDILAGLICYSGVLIIATEGNFQLPGESQMMGIGLALVSTLVWAGYWIFNIQDDRDPVVGLFANFLCSLPLAVTACLLFSTVQVTSLQGLSGAAYIGLMEMGMAFVFWSNALKLTKNTSRVSNLIFLSPFLSLWLISILLDETIHLTTWGGLILILAGLLIQRLGVETSS